MDEPTIEGLRALLPSNARFQVVRLYFNQQTPWAVQVYQRGMTKGGNEKWTKFVLILPRDGETAADVLRMLADMTEEVMSE